VCGRAPRPRSGSAVLPARSTAVHGLRGRARALRPDFAAAVVALDRVAWVAVARRDDRAGAVDFLDRLDHQHAAQGISRIVEASYPIEPAASDGSYAARPSRVAASCSSRQISAFWSTWRGRWTRPAADDNACCGACPGHGRPTGRPAAGPDEPHQCRKQQHGHHEPRAHVHVPAAGRHGILPALAPSRSILTCRARRTTAPFGRLPSKRGLPEGRIV